MDSLCLKFQSKDASSLTIAIMSCILGPTVFMIPHSCQLYWNLYISLLQYNSIIRFIKHLSFHVSLFIPTSLSFSVPCCRAYSDHVNPPHGRGWPAEWPGGYHLSGPPLLLRFPHLPQELFRRWLLPHSCTTNETWHSKGGNLRKWSLVYVCVY